MLGSFSELCKGVYWFSLQIVPEWARMQYTVSNGHQMTVVIHTPCSGSFDIKPGEILLKGLVRLFLYVSQG